LAADTCRLAFVASSDETDFHAALDPDLPLEPVSHVQGLNIGSGKRLDIGVYVRQDKP